MNPDHVYAGTIEADTSGYQDRYERPEHAGATCKRCGALVNDLTQHEQFHALLNQMWGASGLPIGVVAV